MDLTIKGGTKLQRALITEAAELMCKKYFSRYKTLSLEFTVSKKLAAKEGCEGLCFALENTRPRSFEVNIDGNLSISDFIKTIFHELVHVKQYVTSELVDRIRGRAKVTWKGSDHTKTSYSKQPWEREAYRLQEALYKEFLGD